MLKRMWVVFPTLFAAFLVTSTIVDADSHVTLNALLTTVEKLVGYYADNYHMMNLDGIFGLRVLEGQILNLLGQYARGQNVETFPPWAHTRLQEIYARTKDAADSSIKFLKKKSPEYYDHLKPLVDSPMTFAAAYRRIDPTLIWHASEKENITGREFTEEFSDQCMALIMGSTNLTNTKCTFSDECIKMMFTKGQMDYTITHQLLFTVLAEQEGCLPKLNAAMLAAGIPGDVANMRQEFCTNNLFEVAAMVKADGRTIMPRNHDLFMEQEFVCAQLGFMEFLHSDWLAQIIKWQHPSGCYGAMPRMSSFRGKATGDDAEYEYATDGKTNAKHQNEVVKFDQNVPKQDGNRVARVNDAAVVATKDVRRRYAGNAPVVNDGNVDGEPDRREMRPEPRRNEVGNVRSPGLASSANEQGPLGQQGVPNKVDPGQQLQQQQQRQQQQQQKLQFQDHDVGARGQEEIQSVHEQVRNDRRSVVVDVRPVAQEGVAGGVEKEKEPRKQWFQERHGGEMHQLPLRNVPALPQKSAAYRTMRRLLVEEALPDGCLSHKTAVAAGALSQYLRYMLYPGHDDYRRHTRLTGINYIANPHLLLSRAPTGAGDGVVVMEQAETKRDGDRANDAAMKANKSAGIEPKKPDEAGIERKKINEDGIERKKINEDGIELKEVVNQGAGHVAPQGVLRDDVEARSRGDKRTPAITEADLEGDPGIRERDREKEAAWVEKQKNAADGDYYGDPYVGKEMAAMRSKEIVVERADRRGYYTGGANFSAVSLLKSYVLIVAVMFVLVVFLCKFLRKHRVLIRYRHR